MENDGFERIRHKIQYDHMFVVSLHNQGDGLALFWKNEISVAVQNSSDNIDTVVDQACLLLCFMYVVSTLPPRP